MAEFEFKTAKGHSKIHLKSDEKLINISKNHRIIRSAALLERHGGSSGHPEGARGVK